jgi:hypothetical protein
MIDAHHSHCRARQPHPATRALAADPREALALGFLGMFLGSHESGVFLALLAAGLVAVMLLVIFDLDRPERS